MSLPIDTERCAASYRIPSPFDYRGSNGRLDATTDRHPPPATRHPPPASRRQDHFTRLLTRENDRSTVNP
ncbi:hypothetical protein EMIT0158MI4_100198 [Burkholderia ambifaria]